MSVKKLRFPAMILASTVLLMLVVSVFFGIAMKPTITEHAFDFSITYELNGETKTIEDVYSVRYVRNGGYADTKERIYQGNIGDMPEDSTSYVLFEDAEGKIVLLTALYAGYMMGDPQYASYADDALCPQIVYYDREGYEYEDEETLTAKGVRLISYEYSSPIKNSFVFSHVSILSGEIVIPTVLIGLLGLLLTILLVKRDRELVRKPLDVATVICNFLCGCFEVPFFTIVACFSDITGNNGQIFHQMFYFVPALIVLCIAASVALRRKGFSKSSFVLQILILGVFVQLYLLASLDLL